MDSNYKNASILIVDDTPKNIQLLGTVLKDTGYRVLVTTNGNSALSILEKTKPDLILLDVMMPEMDGFETCRRIKMNPNSRDIPVIFLTAKTETDDVLKGFELGAVDYILKPFHANELLARVKTHIELKFSKELIQTLLNFQKGLVIMVQDNKVLYANKSFLNFTEMTDVNEFNQKYSSLNEYFSNLDPSKEDEFRYRLKDNTNKNNIFFVSRTSVPGKNSYILSFTDITDFETEKQNLEVKATIDELTKVFNRNKFQQVFKSIIEEQKVNPRTMSLVIFDVDHFKKVNDNFGHNVGDKVLTKICEIIKKHIRSTDVICRWGGEEFLLLLQGSGIDDAYKISEKIRVIITREDILPEFPVTISLGITEYKQDDTLESFVSRADKALYIAKKTGRNQSIKN